MGSALVIVSKKVFEREFRAGPRPAGIGDVVGSERYTSAHKTLETLQAGGDLFLVTVAADERLWLVGVLRKPRFTGGAWTASANTSPITDITALIPKLAFENGKGLHVRAGALAMSLQTPRALAAGDVALLDAALGGKPEKPTKQTTIAKPAPAAAKSVAAKTVATKSAAKPAAKPAAAQSLVATPSAPVAAGANSDLARAKTQLAQGVLAAALDTLLKAWAGCRAKEIAELVEALGAAIARGLPPIAGKRTTIDELWRDVGDQRRSADVPRLAAALELGSAKQCEHWLDILDQFAIDPRLCAPAIDSSMRFVSSTAGPTRTRAFKLAEKIADGRSIPKIEALLKKQLGAWNSTELKQRIRKMATHFQPPPRLSAADLATVKAIAKDIERVAKQPPLDPTALFRVSVGVEDDGARLLNEVLADPGSDAARLVYADHLQQADDARGELITLQMLRCGQPLTRAQEDRERELLRDKKALQRWLGPLAAVVSEPVFERGFLHRCTVEFKTKKQRAELLGHPLWATVEKIECKDLEVVESPAMRSLKEVAGLDTKRILELARRKQPLALEALTEIAIDLDRDDDDRVHWSEIVGTRAFKKLRSLGPFTMDYLSLEEVGGELAGWKWLLGGSLVKQLTNLTIWLGWQTPSIKQWLKVLDDNPKLERLELQLGRDRGIAKPIDHRCIVTRTKRKLALTLAIDRVQSLDRRDAFPPELLDGFPLASVPELVVTTPVKATKAEREVARNLATQTFGKHFERITFPDA